MLDVVQASSGNSNGNVRTEGADGCGALEFHHKGTALADGREIDAADLFDDPAIFGPDSGIRDRGTVLGYEHQPDDAVGVRFGDRLLSWQPPGE